MGESGASVIIPTGRKMNGVVYRRSVQLSENASAQVLNGLPSRVRGQG